LEGVVRDSVRVALDKIAAQFSDDAPSIDERALRSRYAAVDAWPADAELGLRVVAWALGPGFSMRGFRDAVNRLVPDFSEAASLIMLGPSPTAVSLTGIARRALFNGATVVRWNLNPDLLYWPLDLSSCKV
jgi:hypothetical protein